MPMAQPRLTLGAVGPWRPPRNCSQTAGQWTRSFTCRCPAGFSLRLPCQTAQGAPPALRATSPPSGEARNKEGSGPRPLPLTDVLRNLVLEVLDRGPGAALVLLNLKARRGRVTRSV